MPFFDDTGIDIELEHGPLWGAFATLRDQIEGLTALNIAWAVQLGPGAIALGFPTLPLWLRVPLLLYSGIALAPATAVLYGLIGRAVRAEHLSLELAQDVLRDTALPSLYSLAPLYGLIGLLLGATTWLSSLRGPAEPFLFVAEVLLQLLVLICLVCGNYWGPLFAADPTQTPLSLLRRSLQLVWQAPVRALLVSGSVGLTLLLGAISIGGLVLIVPVVVALLQTHMVIDIHQRRT